MTTYPTTEFFYELARGVEDPDRLAQRFGINEDQWHLMKTDAAFKRRVDLLKGELEKSGYTDQLRVRIMVMALAERAFLNAMARDAHPELAAKTIRTLIPISGMTPRGDELDKDKGPGFQISITIGGQKISIGGMGSGNGGGSPSMNVIDIKPEQDNLISKIPPLPTALADLMPSDVL